MQRERLGSRLGFILLSAGSAIGIGNVWKFPYMVGQNGGALFVLLYLLFLVILGVPVMTMEFSLGRASQKSPAKIYNELEPRGAKWHTHSNFMYVGNYILMMFYTVVSGWMVKYFIDTTKGDFKGVSEEYVGVHYDNMLQEPTELIIYTFLVIIVCFAICSFSLQNGLERVTKYMMLLLLGLMVVLAINSATMPGGAEGLKFYLVPDVNKVKEIGVFNVVVAAMNQSFFTLSLGLGAMAIFGSYIDKKRSLLGESVNVALLDTLVAVCSGFIIFPACSTYNLNVDAGPSLIFKTLPNIFRNLPAGSFWGAVFFLFLSFAALTTMLATFENIISCTMDKFGFSRRKSAVINCLLMLVLSLPCILGFNVLKDVNPFGAGSTIMDLEDFAVSNVLLPLGSLIFVLFCTSKKGWGWKNFVAEANEGKGIKIKNWMRIYITYVLPVIIVALFLIGIYNFFK